MSRRDSRRGGGALKGLSVVLAVLVLLTLYLVWQGDLSFGGIPALFLDIPLWFYFLAMITALAAGGVAAAVRTGRARESRDQLRDIGAPNVAGVPIDAMLAETAIAPQATKRERIVIPFLPVSTTVSERKSGPSTPSAHVSLAALAREPVIPPTAAPLHQPPRKALVITPAHATPGPSSAPEPTQVTRPEPEPAPTRRAEPVFIPELESAPERLAMHGAEPAPAAAPSGRPETLLSRLIDWLEDTSPEVLTSREKPRAPRVLKRRR